MTRWAPRAAVVLTGAALLVVACQSDRDRPGPPRLAITLNQDSVGSPDTLTGTVRADDLDGIDSVWLQVDTTVSAADALLDRTFIATFRGNINSGHVLGDRVLVRLTARDVTGFVGGLDTFVVVKGP